MSSKRQKSASPGLSAALIGLGLSDLHEGSLEREAFQGTVLLKPCGDAGDVANLAEFRAQLYRTCPVLERVFAAKYPEGVAAVLAGGAVFCHLFKKLRLSARCKNSDIDIFIVGLMSDAQARELLETLIAIILNGKQPHKLKRSPNCVDVQAERDSPSIQIVLKENKTLASALHDFDIDCITMAFDGARVFVTERGRTALRTRYNMAIPDQRSW